MLVSNHVLAGSAIALTVRQPALAIPLALASHYLLDALPHFGYSRQGYGVLMQYRTTYFALVLDIVCLSILLVTLVPIEWGVFAAAWVALAPDLIWPYRYFYYERKGLTPPETIFTRFHHMIQWCERPWGLLVEIGFFIAGFMTLQHILRV